MTSPHVTSGPPTRTGPFPANLDIVLGVSAESGADQIARQLQRDHARVRRLWPLPDKVPSDADVLVLEYSAALIDRLPWSPGEPACALVIVVAAEHTADLAHLCDCTPEAFLFAPAQAEAITATVLLALNQFDYTKRLRDRIERLDQNLRTIRNVERAKSILVSTKGLSEDAAYKFLRKQAMERRTTVNAIASAVIDSFELLG